MWVWKIVTISLSLSLLFQYVVILGNAPFMVADNYTNLPIAWTSLDPISSNFFVVGSIRPILLLGEFLALLFALIHLRHLSIVALKSYLSDDSKCNICIAIEMVRVDSPKHQDNSLQSKFDSRLAATIDKEWHRIGFYFTMVSDKIILILILCFGCVNPSLISFGYIIIPLLLLLTGEFSSLICSNVKEKMMSGKLVRQRLRVLQYYNFVYLCILLIYQIPFIPEDLNDGYFDWESITGLLKINSNSFYISIILNSLIIFFILDLQNKLKGYDDELEDYYNDLKSESILVHGKLMCYYFSFYYNILVL